MHISEELLTITYNHLLSLKYYADLTLYRIKELYELTYILGFEELQEKVRQLILNGNYRQEFRGLGNIEFKIINQTEFEEETIKDLLNLESLDKLNNKYPKWDKEYYTQQYKNYSREYSQINMVISSNFDEAVQECFHPKFGLDGQCLELIISYLFIIGNFEKGIEIKSKYVEHDFSLRYLQFVEMIERVRYEGWDKNELNFRKYFPKENIYDPVAFAKGFSGLLPHDIYPWTDEWEFH